MKTITVENFPGSSNINKLVYRAKKQTLETTFKNGKTYRYSDVTEDEFKQLKEAESVGKAHNELIVKTDKPCQKI